MTRPEQLFLFNSSLPDGAGSRDLLMSMGPSFPGIRGQNIGNSYISYGLLKSLFRHPVKVAHIANAWDHPLPDQLAEEINEKYSHFVFILQDYIRESFSDLPFENITRFIEKIKIPIVPMSLCANSFNGFDRSLSDRLGGAQKRFLAVIAEKSKKIGVRGYYTADVLNCIGIKNVKVIGCPSYFENGPNRILVKRPWNSAKVVTTATFFNRGLPNTSHLLQDELYFINLIFLGGNALPLEVNSTANAFNLDEIANSFHLLSKAITGHLEFFSDLNKWADFFRNNDHCLTVGTRLHSGMFSINNGVPAIVTNPDARARETCEYLSIPYDPTIDSSSNIHAIYDKLDLDSMNGAYPELYGNFLSYLEEHGLTPSPISDDAECISFPPSRKCMDESVLAELHRAFADLTIAVEREAITLQAFGGEKATRARDKLRAIMLRYPSLSSSSYYASLNRALQS